MTFWENELVSHLRFNGCMFQMPADLQQAVTNLAKHPSGPTYIWPALRLPAPLGYAVSHTGAILCICSLHLLRMKRLVGYRTTNAQVTGHPTDQITVKTKKLFLVGCLTMKMTRKWRVLPVQFNFLHVEVAYNGWQWRSQWLSLAFLWRNPH